MRVAIALLGLTAAWLISPPVALATSSQSEQFAASLIDGKGRYTIGPWSGYEMQNTCFLANTEPLVGADFTISAVKGGAAVKFQLGERAASVEQSLEDLSRLAFFTLDGHTYDMHGFAAAMKLFNDCKAGHLADNLPDEPVEESDPVSVSGADNWQLTTLSMGDYVYARLVTLAGEGTYGLGIWRHNTDDYLLNVTALGGLPTLADPPILEVTFAENQPPLRLRYLAQKDGLLLSVKESELATLAGAQALKLVSGGFTAEFATSGLAQAVRALK